jgi:hypothetical protein
MATTDTHTVIEALIASGTSKEAAKVFVENFVIKEELSSIEKEQAQLATKMDIVRLESKIESAENRLNSSIRDILKDVSWIKTISLANFTVLFGALITMLFKSFG